MPRPFGRGPALTGMMIGERLAVQLELVIKTANGRERSFPIQTERMVIGRETRCDVRVPLPNVDAEHCEIVLADGVVELKDLGSEAGTFFKGGRVDRVVLDEADRFTVGPVEFELRKRQAS